jgi:hypothetical protein
MVTNCGVGASNPRCIYIRPFCIDTASFTGDQASSPGEMPIRKALAPVEFANDLKEQLEKIAPARILRDNQTPRTGWLVEGQFDRVSGRSYLGLHVKVTDVDQGVVVYEFDMAGGNNGQAVFGTLRAAGLGRALHFDLQNAAERIYITLSTNPRRFGARNDLTLQ